MQAVARKQRVALITETRMSIIMGKNYGIGKFWKE